LPRAVWATLTKEDCCFLCEKNQKKLLGKKKDVRLRREGRKEKLQWQIEKKTPEESGRSRKDIS